ncbi:MAG TPA: glycosyltransferase family 2 protein [Aquella sp.]|nr:glycosyltransferase family 2 protein [Aquella sp.]
MGPFLSIIIPTYNSFSTIESCLNSVRDQIFLDYEVIVVDGLSEDETITFVKARASADPKIKLFSDKDYGIYDAMNKGIEYARGKWLYFLGSDDSLFDHRVLFDFASIANKISAPVIYGNVKIVGQTAWSSDGAIYDGKFDLKKLLTKNICHQAIFYKADFIRAIRYNIKYSICADWDFNMKCWSKGKFIYMNRVIANFHGGGASTNNSRDVSFEEEIEQNIIQYFGVNKSKKK